MVEELVIQIDENDNQIGLRTRRDFHKYDIYHRSAVLLLFNKKGELLLQKRGGKKKWFPNMYDFSVAGTVGNETYEQCMKRETKEELGIEVAFEMLFKMLPWEKDDKVSHAVFVATTDQDLVLDEEEMDSVRWISLEKLEEEIGQNPEQFTPQLFVGLGKYLKLKRH